jgi:hypothetical protein
MPERPTAGNGQLENQKVATIDSKLINSGPPLIDVQDFLTRGEISTHGRHLPVSGLYLFATDS